MRKSLLLLFAFSLLCTVLLALPLVSAQNLIISEISAQNFSGLPNKDFDGSFKITNNASVDLNIDIDYSGLSGLEIDFSDDSLTLSSGQSSNIDFDITSEPGDKGVFTGTFFARDNKNNKSSFNVMVNLTLPSNFTGLKINNVRFDNKALDPYENLTGFKAGQLVDLEFDLKNLFEEKDDPQIDNLDFNVRIEDFTDESSRDLEIVIKDFDRTLEPDKNEKFYSEEFRIPHDISNNKSYKLIIEVDGEDDENEDYNVIFEAFIIPEKKEEDIGFADVSFSNAKCGEPFTIDVELANTGMKKVEKGSFLVKIDELSLQESSKIHDEIKENETVSESISLNIPSDAKEKTYTLKLISFFKGAEKQSEIHPLKLTCATPVQVTQTNNQTQNDSVNIQQNTDTQNQSIQTNKTQLDDKRIDSIDKDNNSGLVIGILAGMVLLIIVLVVLLIYMFRK